MNLDTTYLIENKQILKVNCDSIYKSGEKMPRFTGGDVELIKYTTNKILPIINEANKVQKELITKIHSSLIISKEGKILSSTIITDLEKELKDKLEKALMKMPDWIPGEVNGKAECMKITIPMRVEWE